MIMIILLPKTKVPGNEGQYLIPLPYKQKMFNIWGIANKEKIS